MSKLILVKGNDSAWNSISDAAKALGTSQHKLERAVNRGESDLELVYTEIQSRAKPVKCLESGEVFASLTALARELGMTVSAVSQNLATGATVIQGRHYSLITPSEFAEKAYC